MAEGKEKEGKEKKKRKQGKKEDGKLCKRSHGCFEPQSVTSFFFFLCLRDKSILNLR